MPSHGRPSPFARRLKVLVSFGLAQKTAFQGLGLHEAKKSASALFAVDNNRSSTASVVSRKGLEVSARTAGASKTIEVEVDKPLGLTLGQKSGGGVVITVSSRLRLSYLSMFHSHFSLTFVKAGDCLDICLIAWSSSQPRAMVPRFPDCFAHDYCLIYILLWVLLCTDVDLGKKWLI